MQWFCFQRPTLFTYLISTYQCDLFQYYLLCMPSTESWPLCLLCCHWPWTLPLVEDPLHCFASFPSSLSGKNLEDEDSLIWPPTVSPNPCHSVGAWQMMNWTGLILSDLGAYDPLIMWTSFGFGMLSVVVFLLLHRAFPLPFLYYSLRGRCRIMNR